MALLATALWIRGLFGIAVGTALLLIGLKLLPLGTPIKWFWMGKPLTMSDVRDSQVRVLTVLGGAIAIVGLLVMVGDLIT